MRRETVRQSRRIVGMRFLRPIRDYPLTQANKGERVALQYISSKIGLTYGGAVRSYLLMNQRSVWRKEHGTSGECLVSALMVSTDRLHNTPYK